MLIVGVETLHGLGDHVAGQVAVLLSALLYGCAAVYGRRLSHLPAAVTAACTMIWATALLVPLSIVIDRPWTLSPSLTSIVAATILGILCTGVAMLLYFRLLRTIGSMGVASQSYLRAGVSVLLGILILGEQFRPNTFFGLSAVILGVALINTSAGARVVGDHSKKAQT